MNFLYSPQSVHMPPSAGNQVPCGVAKHVGPFPFKGSKMVCNNFSNLSSDGSSKFLDSYYFCGSVKLPYNPKPQSLTTAVPRNTSYHRHLQVCFPLARHSDHHLINFLVNRFFLGVYLVLRVILKSSFACNNIQFAPQSTACQLYPCAPQW